MGLPIDAALRQYSRPTHTLRNDRLTEREKLALREAELNSHLAIRQESIASRQNIHNAYLEHTRREVTVPGHALFPPGPITSLPRQGVCNEQIRLMSLKKQEEENIREQESQQINGYPAVEQRDLFLSSTKKVRQ